MGNNFTIVNREIVRLTRGPQGKYGRDMSGKKFRDALLETLEQRRISMRSLAEGAGVSYEQLKKLKQGAAQTTNVDDAKKIVDFLGVSLAELMDDPEIPGPLEIVDLYNQLSDDERRILIAAARGMRGQRQVED